MVEDQDINEFYLDRELNSDLLNHCTETINNWAIRPDK